MRRTPKATVGVVLVAAIGIGAVMAAGLAGPGPRPGVGSNPEAPALATSRSTVAAMAVPAEPAPPPAAAATSAGRSSAGAASASASGAAPLGVLVPSCGGYQLCAVPGYPGVYSTPGTVYDPQAHRAAVIPTRSPASRAYLCFEERTC